MTPASRVMLPMDVALSVGVGAVWVLQGESRVSRLTVAINAHGWTQPMVGWVLLGIGACLLVTFLLGYAPAMAITLGAGAFAYFILGCLLLHPGRDDSQTGTLFMFYISAAHLASMLTLSFRGDS